MTALAVMNQQPLAINYLPSNRMSELTIDEIDLVSGAWGIDLFGHGFDATNGGNWGNTWAQTGIWAGAGAIGGASGGWAGAGLGALGGAFGGFFGSFTYSFY